MMVVLVILMDRSTMWVVQDFDEFRGMNEGK